jgi:hypothetical protein
MTELSESIWVLPVSGIAKFNGSSAFRVIHCRVSQRLQYTLSLCVFPGHILFRFHVSNDNHAHFSAFWKVLENTGSCTGRCTWSMGPAL